MSDGPSAQTGRLHQRLIDQLVADAVITSGAVEAAFRAVPRHPFVPNEPLNVVYADAPIVTKRRDDSIPISSSSQPAAMAIMLEQLEVQPGDRILEIGAGTGYNAAVLAHLAGPAGHVIRTPISSRRPVLISRPPRYWIVHQSRSSKLTAVMVGPMPPHTTASFSPSATGTSSRSGSNS